MEKTIYYGFGKEYLKTWGTQEALREIYQNFIDYGDYTEESDVDDNGLAYVCLENDWVPESLDFLRIGNSRKGNGEAIGKHGEGLKMAFLIFLRNKDWACIITPKYLIIPKFYVDEEIGECFCLNYEEHKIENQKFTITFICKSEDFDKFKSNIIFNTDIVYTDNYWGQIVNKPKGNIYSGKLFVCNVDNVSKAYNINPKHLPLDRDRMAPRSFDLSYAASQINNSYGKWNTKDLSYSDTRYVNSVPEEIKKDFKPKMVGNEIQFVFKDEKGVDTVLNNDTVKNILKNDSFFAVAIKKLKKYIVRKLGLYDLLIEFKEKHVHSAEMLADFEIILDKVEK